MKVYVVCCTSTFIIRKVFKEVNQELVESIKRLIEACEDMALLDLIFQLLKKTGVIGF